jgi:hypothetical protein
VKITNSARKLFACSIAAFLLEAAPISVLAQEKGAERLVKLHRLHSAADGQKVQAGDAVVMSCSKCKDTWAKVVQPPGRGGRQELATVQRHECPGCGTRIETQGAGKQATSTIKHVSTRCGSADAQCAVMKKGAVTESRGEGQKARH